MIEIKNLTKIYKTSRKEKCIAVNDVSLTLPSSGMIFVTGKSGSGKSTLLNMIGTLDNITSGDIIVDGVSFKKFKEKDFQEYRSSYLGFIFQDFLLLEELTVKENISLALKISGSEDEEYLDEIIKRVELDGKEDKFPNELSGGQRQRVAIARSLVKKPNMLLCDEPTGNLDYKTSKQILDILKEESKTKLVIVVSHNTEDAENYADRIIELMDGKIVKDHTKSKDYQNHLVVYDNYVILPHHKDLTVKEVNTLNEKLANEKFKVVQNKGGFFPTKTVEETKQDFKLKSSHLGRKNSLKISSMFFRKNKHGAPYTIIITSLFISLFYIFQVLVSFNQNMAIEKVRSKETLSVIRLTDQTIVGSLSSSNLLDINDEMIQSYYEAGYKGEIYPLYNFGLSLSTNMIQIDSYSRITSMLNYASATEAFGTLCCTEEYLKTIFPTKEVNGEEELIVLAGNLADCDQYLVITDYFADLIMARKTNNYTDYNNLVQNHPNVGAIIYTGYKEKYADVLKNAENAKANKVSSSDFLIQYSKDEQTIEFFKEVQNKLAICFTFSSDLCVDLFTNYHPTTLHMSNMYFDVNGTPTKLNSGFSVTTKKDYVGTDITMSYNAFNELFGTFYTQLNIDTFEPVDIVIRKYEQNDPTKDVIYEKKVTVTNLGNSNVISQELFDEFIKVKYHCYGLYFDDIEQYDTVVKVSDNQGLLVSSVDTAVIPVINTILEIFKGLCYLIIVLLFIVSFSHIVLYGINSIRKNIYEIGVLKALGTKSIDIAKIFIVQIAVIGFAISIVSILGIYLSSILSDLLLISAFEEFLTITIYGLNIIPVNIPVVSLDLTLVFIISIISSIIPLIYLKTIKPLNILKGKKK